MRLLPHEILRAMIFSNWITRDRCARRRKRVKAVHIIEHVAEVQRVCRRQVMINAQAKLVPIVASYPA